MPTVHLPLARSAARSAARAAARPLTLLLISLSALLALTACGGAPPAPADPPAVVVRTSTSTPTATPTPTSTATRTPTPTPTPTPRAAVPARPPESGRWIDVDVTRYLVRLMDGKQVVREIGPVAIGRQVDTGAYESTQTGLFHVYVKTAPRTFDAPYNTYIQWWVGFDPAKDNGFHSFLLDADGKVVDGSTGRVSNGCIRTGEAEAVFNFAEINMPVYVHA
ncbi:MAG: L,D-transpeptidase [Dehalococcoidia bacterium]